MGRPAAKRDRGYGHRGQRPGAAPRGYHGQADAAGYTLRTRRWRWRTRAAAADLVLGKLERVPAALVRGYPAGGDGTARELIREAERDLFISPVAR